MEINEKRIMIMGEKKMMIDYGKEEEKSEMFYMEEENKLVIDIWEKVMIGIKEGKKIVDMKEKI